MKKNFFGFAFIGTLLLACAPMGAMEETVEFGQLVGNKQETLRRIKKKIMSYLEKAMDSPDAYEYNVVFSTVGDAVGEIRGLNIREGIAAENNIMTALDKFANKKGGYVVGYGGKREEKFEKELEKILEKEEFPKVEKEEFPPTPKKKEEGFPDVSELEEGGFPEVEEEGFPDYSGFPEL